MAPLRTQRLLLRPMTLADGPIVAAYRNDPQIAAMQDWPLPYTEQDFVDRWHRRQAAGPMDDLRHPTNLAIEVGGNVVGDVYGAVRDGVAEVGWTLTLPAQGKGYAHEAAAIVVEELFTRYDVQRVHASMHPDNLASARVCEAIGMSFEARTRLSFHGRHGLEDDTQYSMLRSDWDAWVNRPRHTPAATRLAELGPHNAAEYGRLRTHRSQERLVAPMAQSFRDALFPEVIDGAPVRPWMRGIEADAQPVGFVMLAAATEHHPEPYLWRLLIDRLHQRRGIGEQALALVFDSLRAEGSASVIVSWVDGPGSPRPFYERLGFVPTGEIVDGEIEARLIL